MVQQDLETLHRITWPGVVASDNDIGRRGSSSLEPAANLGRKLLLDDLGPAANQPENLPGPPVRWLIEKHGPMRSAAW